MWHEKLERLALLLQPRTLIQSAIMWTTGMAYAISLPLMSVYAINVAELSKLQFVFLSTGSVAVGIAVSVFLGRAADSARRREPYAIICLLAGVSSYFIFANTRDQLLILGTSITFFGVYGAALAQVFALVRSRIDSHSTNNSTLLVGGTRAAFSLAWVIGPPVGTKLFEMYGISAAFQATALLLFFASILIAVSVDRNRSLIGVTNRATTGLILENFRPDARMAFSGLALLLFSLCSNLSIITLPLYLAPDITSIGRVGLLFGLAAALEVPLMLLISALASNRLRLMLTAALVYTGYTAILASTTNFTRLALAQALNAYATAVFMGVGLSYFQDLIPKRVATGTAVFSAAINTGTLLAGPIFATVIAVSDYAAVFATSSVLSLVAAASILFAIALSARPVTRVT